MAGAQDSELVIAVSNAGGLGMLPCAMFSSEQCRKQLQRIRERTSRPYGVNFFAHRASAPQAQQISQWKSRFLPYYREFGLDVVPDPSGPGRMPFDEEAATIVEEFQPPVVSFHFGLPDGRLVERVRRTGALILSSATTVAEAVWLADNGVDAIIAQGYEAGGHRGMFLTDDLDTQTGTLALVSQIVSAVDLPVIAAGGIADAAGVRAVLDLGAIAAQIGTAYLLTDEATTSAVHRQALRAGHARHTAITNVFSGRPARGIVNRLIRELGPMSPDAPTFPHATFASAPLRSMAEQQGLEDFSPLWSGQNPSGCKEGPAAVLTRSLASAI